MQFVGEAEPVTPAELLQVLDDVGRWRVVVGDAGLEGKLRSAGDRLRRDP